MFDEKSIYQHLADTLTSLEEGLAMLREEEEKDKSYASDSEDYQDPPDDSGG